MDWFLDPSDERRAGLRREARRCSSRPRPSCPRTTSRSATSPARRASSRGSSSGSPSSAPTRPGTRTRRSSTSSCRTTCKVQRRRHGARGRRGRGRAERRPRDRHVAHGQARASSPTSCAASRPITSPGSSSATAAYEDMDDRVDEVDQPPPAARRGRVPGRASTSAVCRELGYAGPWGVEVLSEELRNLPIEQIFDRAYETTSAQLAAVTRKEPSVSETPRPRTADLDVHADAADPRVRGAGQEHVRWSTRA